MHEQEDSSLELINCQDEAESSFAKVYSQRRYRNTPKSAYHGVWYLSCQRIPFLREYTSGQVMGHGVLSNAASSALTVRLSPSEYPPVGRPQHRRPGSAPARHEELQVARGRMLTPCQAVGRLAIRNTFVP